MELLSIPKNIETIYTLDDSPKFYWYPSSTITNIDDHHIEIYHQHIYEPVSIITMNIDVDDIQYEKFDGNKDKWDNDKYKKCRKLNMVHCECCMNHAIPKNIIKEEPINTELISPYSHYYNNTCDEKFKGILSDESYKSDYRNYAGNCSYSLGNGMCLDIWFSKIYIICDNENNIVSLLHAPGYELQLGNSYTKVKLINEETVTVENDGDVWSVIVIKF